MPDDVNDILTEPQARCACCGGAGTILHRDLVDPHFGVPGRWTMRRCADPGCGLGWLDPHPRRDEIWKLYRDYYTHGATAEGEPAPPAETYRTTGRKALVKRLLAALFFWKRPVFATDLMHLQSVPPGRLLEVGCGGGSFLAAAARAGWAAHGIDFDEKAVAAAKRLPGVDAEVADLLERRFPDAAFDAVVMSNVIEHLPDPAAVFAECHRILAPGGRVVFITPNMDALGHDLMGRYWRGLEPPRHLYLYNVATLRRFARAAGFAGILAFSSPGQGMIEASNDIARRAGAPERQQDPKEVRRRTLLQGLLGRARGEWVVLVATKARRA